MPNGRWCAGTAMDRRALCISGPARCSVHMAAGRLLIPRGAGEGEARDRAEQRANHLYGLLMIKKPPIPGGLQLAWPFIRRFTERVFAEDRMAVEAEQRAWEEQGEDWNHEVFPLIVEVRNVLRTNGVPIRPESARCGAAAL